MKGKILLVEDNEIYAKIIKVCLDESEHEVHVRKDGESALKDVENIMPHAILLDIILPGISGIAVCKKLKENPSLRSIPVIMLSAKSEEGIVQSAIRAGANDYITKNNDIETVWKEIEDKILNSLIMQVQTTFEDGIPPGDSKS